MRRQLADAMLEHVRRHAAALVREPHRQQELRHLRRRVARTLAHAPALVPLAAGSHKVLHAARGRQHGARAAGRRRVHVGEAIAEAVGQRRHRRLIEANEKIMLDVLEVRVAVDRQQSLALVVAHRERERVRECERVGE